MNDANECEAHQILLRDPIMFVLFDSLIVWPIGSADSFSYAFLWSSLIETPGQGQRLSRGGERERTPRACEIPQAAFTWVWLPLGGQTGVPGGYVKMLSSARSRLRVGARGTLGERETVPAVPDGEAASTARTLHRDDGPS